jgi:uncharacterized protein involved in type VI secretion and phage assembly
VSLVDLLNNNEEDETGDQVSGVVVGIVTDNKDPEKMGRVKINFPWRGEEGEEQTHWARISTFMAGKDRGSFFMPEVHDEVLVAFDRGDIDHPFIVGSLWNGKDNPPETNDDGKNNIRKIKSRSGHEIIFDDNAEEKKEKLEIHTKAGHKVLLDDTVGKEKIEITDKTGNNKMVIDSVKNSIDIESAGQLNIKAKMITIEATGNLTVKSGAVLTIEGTMVKIN